MIKISKLIPLLLLLYLVVLPRFNWRDLPQPFNQFVGEKPFDVVQYQKYVQFFRGNKNVANELEGPFSYRPLVPLLASVIPFQSNTSINLINLFFLTLGLIYLLRLLRLFGFNENQSIIGGLFFILSFPLFYYATSGYIDGSLLGILLISTYYLFDDKYFLFILTFTLGIFIKETIIILLPVAIIEFMIKEKSKIKFLKVIIPVLLYFLVIVLIRKIAPHKESYVWKPSIDILIYNLVRVKTYLSFLLTFGIPGLLATYLIITKKIQMISKEISYPILAGFLFSFLLWLYSLFAAYSDGRQLWITYVFSIPLALFVIQHREKNAK
ncbi:hypothetical protein [Ignavibacterium sp.]|uniref:hypothetical protein n=1 Tax=Ignavibacterium sp. TaxID=2651167 RepID=UPI00307E9FB1